MNLPLVRIYAQLMNPFFIFMISSSIQIHLLNTALCVHAYYLNSRRFLEIFEVTLVNKQFRQVCSLIPTGIFYCFITMGVLTLRKVVEAEIWRLAQENYAKSEFLTKEVVQAMEAKDTFVSILSHEIRNPLNSLKGSIDYLLQVIKSHQYIQVLKNAKMSGDILLNLVSNVLDAAKLKSNKMEIVCMETDLVDTIKKVYAINSEKFKEKKLLAKAFIDESVPKLLWIDPSRLLQILMNLLSNSVKFTPENGRISMYVSWCPSNEKKEHLLAPFKNIGPDGEPEQKNHHKSLDLHQNIILKRNR